MSYSFGCLTMTGRALRCPLPTRDEAEALRRIARWRSALHRPIPSVYFPCTPLAYPIWTLRFTPVQWTDRHQPYGLSQDANNSARNGNDNPLITSQRRRSVVGRLKDQVNRLARHRVGRRLHTGGERGGIRQHDLSRISPHVFPLPPLHDDLVPVRIGRHTLQANRLARSSGNPQVSPNHHARLMVSVGALRSHRPLHAGREPVLRGGREIRALRRRPSGSSIALTCRIAQAVSRPTAKRSILVSEQSVV